MPLMEKQLSHWARDNKHLSGRRPVRKETITMTSEFIKALLGLFLMIVLVILSFTTEDVLYSKLFTVLGIITGACAYQELSTHQPLNNE